MKFGTPEETERVIARNQRFAWSSTPVRNYRDYAATSFDLAFAQWIWGVGQACALSLGTLTSPYD